MSFRSAAHRVLPLALLGSTMACALAIPEKVYLDRVAAPGALTSQVDAVMKQYEAQGFGGAVLVAKGNRVLLYQGYDYANRARHLPNTAQTKYPLGALTEPFTAAVFLQLEREGRLKLDQPASDWIGPEAGHFTIADLLRRAPEAGNLARPAAFGTGEPSIVDRLAAPSQSYVLLDQVLQAVTGKPPMDVLRDRLFRPAGLDRTEVDDGELNDSLVARGYTGAYGSTVVVTGLVAPLGDVFRWHQALRLGLLLSPADRERMFTDAPNGYGLGWVVHRTPSGARIVEHASDQRGFQLWYGYFPESDQLVLLAVNSDLGYRQPIAERLTQLLVDGEAYAQSLSSGKVGGGS